MHFSFIGLLQFRDIDLAHLQHRVERALRLLEVLVGDHLEEDRRGYLPRQSVLVFKPAARAFLPATGEQLLPVVVDLLLVLAVDHERDRLGELEVRPAVQRDVLLVAEAKLHRQHRALGGPAAFEVARDAEDLRVLEHRAVELRRFFGFLVEPEERSDSLHAYSPFDLSRRSCFSRWLRVREAARLNWLRASWKRPSRASRSPRTAGSRW